LEGEDFGTGDEVVAERVEVGVGRRTISQFSE
jgi:hypothetical protein